MNLRVLVRVLVVGLLALFATMSYGQAPVPLADFFKRPAYRNVSLSPNGKLLAAIVPNGLRNGIVVIDLEKKSGNVVAAYRDADIRGFSWVNNKRVVYDLLDMQAGLAEQKANGLFAVDIDGGSARVIAPQTGVDASGVNFVWRHPQLVDTIIDEPAETDDVYVVAGERNVTSPDVYRLNTRTGTKKLMTFDNPGDGRGFWVHNGAVKAVMSEDDATGQIKIYLRESAASKWRLASTHNRYALTAMMPIRFDYDGTLYVQSTVGRDTTAIFKWDTKTDKLGEMIASHNRFDLTSPVFDRVKKKVVGVYAEMDKPTIVWVDEDWARIQAMVDAALPGKVNILSRSGGSHVLVSSSSHLDPTTWYLLDPAAKKLEEVVSAMPWIKANQMSEVKFIQYPARDGLLIPAYLTLPKGKDPKNLPLIVNVHGGPFVRGDTYGWNPEDQFLASRGYAVLAINFRGTEGHGWKHYAAGWKQWALPCKMI
jgi:dipeptidyl aminopeptidase/acylaminoacyl peptidase